MKVIITGASKGIGKAIAMKFAEEGYDLLLCARNEKSLSETAREVQKISAVGKVDYTTADLSSKEQATAFGEWCLTKGKPDILINNAGNYAPGNCLGEDDSLEEMIANNLYSAYYLTRVIAPQMIKNRSGHIFNISSIAALDAYEGGGSYSISKFAMHGFSKNLRHELKTHGVKVTTVFPGAVLTGSWEGFDNSSKRIMVPADIAELVFSCSKLSPQAVVEEIIVRPQLGDL